GESADLDELGELGSQKIFTDNAGQGDRAEFLSPHWPEIAFVIYSAHSVNYIVKAALKSDSAKISKASTDATRWNSVHGFFASLLRRALAILKLKSLDDNDFPSALLVIGNVTFWEVQSDAGKNIRRSAFSSIKLRRDEKTMADVIGCYLCIFTGFAT
ncbi:hypothetical protein GN958_ATG04166, partial [Phytophthora infestans]